VTPDHAELVRKLKDRGLRVTSPRLAVLGAVADLGGHPSAEQIAARARERLGAVSTQAVYDSLHALADAGLLRRMEPAGSPARYETRVGDNHHHVVCRQCGATRDIDCLVGEAPCLEPSDLGGFEIDQAEVTFWGLCPACRGSTELSNS
jgi:Fur family transcriptional regulator, stress-responsive regulator